ncbi:nuclease-related domain-containing protein [Salinicoccus halodurans]|uniref:Nuclease-related domain-containing protein n=1 Tax=Salinicoccus halodurans TaxID=407035 RepID=A0A0F7HJ06_9STAP|nr:nuclease-related domain-containing protein [Salinicoccus halodurans]AKG73533.1 hypothetical protein AAT16_04475 [Salinicoccus halodurans]SFK52181.1 Nuclease-related domain-containing protein [Salinicoccus halodurans]
MFVTERNRSRNHIYLEVRKSRAELDRKEERSLEWYRSGYEGEQEYDAVLDAVGHGPLYVFRDIWLGVQDSKVQLDTLIVADNIMIVNEIKNYSGNYSYEEGVWKVRGHQISEDPVSQISVAANKLLKLRYDTGIHFEIQKEIVFVNPYMIFGPTDYKNVNLFVMRNRLKQYFRSLHNNTSGRSAKVLAEEIAGRIIENPHPAPKADKGRIKFGVNCCKCSSFAVLMKRFCVECPACGYVEPVERSVVRAAIEFSVLFPEEKVTRGGIYEFLGKKIDSQKIQRRMRQYFPLIFKGNHSHYKMVHKDVGECLSAGNYASYYEHDPDFIFEGHPRYHKLKGVNRNYMREK